MSETGSIEKYIIEKWEIMEPVGTHLPCAKKKKSSMKKKVGVKRKAIKKDQEREKKKKAYFGTSPLPFRPVLFVTSSHHFHKECVRSSGLFF